MIGPERISPTLQYQVDQTALNCSKISERINAHVSIYSSGKEGSK